MPDWNVTVGHATGKSVLIHWQNLASLINQQMVYYIALISNKNGRTINAVLVSGNATLASIPGLSTYVEYKVRVIGVNSDWQTYQSSNVTAWTDEGGKWVLECLHQQAKS